jgi:tRNA(His) 5'-end guanylyltransferase
MTGSGFRLIYGYTESDEISLLFHPEDNTFSRKVRKLNTTLAGEASALFSLALGRAASFDCRIIPLPNMKLVADYFAWRQEDSHRNSLNAHCYWIMRKDGMDKNAATDILRSKDNAFKNELLFQKGINYNDLPSWQKRGVGLYFRTVQKEGFNPVTQEKVMADRKELYTDFELPIGDAYRDFITDLLTRAE